MEPSTERTLVYDWAGHGPHQFIPPRTTMVNDETLRDGLQNPSVVDPPLEAKIRILHLMEALGMESASLGLPVAGQRQYDTAEELCREIARNGLNVRPNCGGRTLVDDVRPIVDISQKTGLMMEACLFIGSSPIRRYVEAWDERQILQRSRESVEFAVREGLRVTYITEDTTRSSPEHLKPMLVAAIDAGAERVCLCDTVGSAIPEGTRNLVEWVRTLLADMGVEVGIDWHGHRDRGLGLANTLAAIQAGATRVHGTAMGIGERVGNTSTEEILINLKLLGLRDGDLTRLPEYVQTVADSVGMEIPAGAPIVGRDAYRTASGIHGAAIVKAQAKGDTWLADRVYSGVPASWLGRRQEVEIGPLSGRSNVVHFLKSHGLAEEPEVIAAVLALAKASTRVLQKDEILTAIDETTARR